ncbi:MAG: NADH-quinone oxidoreductase subunit NuoK [Planctomycetes bacterium]|nr:NADH-quinone oxidoreductase subunit NuoK [Planctomycetota bacterium]
MSLLDAYPLQHYLLVSAALFALGIFTLVARKNAVAMLMGVELILNSANLNFVAFSRYTVGNFSGHLFAIFVILLAAAEAAVALGIVIGIFQNYGDVDADALDGLKG